MFSTVGSFILGLGLVVLFKPMCKKADCMIQKAPSVEEVTKTTYQIGNACYQFRTTPVDCPKTGVIEPFEVRAPRT